ncbi:DUF4331 family protein [Maribacter sp. 2210JD10-5]|uniref:DUF4331 family protein n=1 Tax=Maribacter sp. 2210JD10-5 TaxID=3386272 RepID=UPI0039BC750C
MKLDTIKNIMLSLGVTFLLASCDTDDNGIQMMEETVPDFSGTFTQVDYMGRPGINTVLGADGDIKDAHNLSTPSNQATTFQAGYQTRLEALHDAYAVALGLTAEDVDYEPNILSGILGFDVTAEILTSVLASDVLEVAPNAQTVYFDGSVPIGFTGRQLSDDVIDVSLILLFGGENGDRFNGQEGLPQLITDGVGITADISTTFPYLGAPE